MIGDPNNQRWTASEVQDKLQEGQEQFVIDTRCLFDRQNFSIVDGTSEYALNDYVIDIDRLTHNRLLLKRKSRHELDIEYGSSDWEDDTGTPIHYLVDLDPGEQKLRLHPTPQSEDAGTDNLVMIYISLPDTMSGDSSVPFTTPSGATASTLLAPYHMAVAYWTAADLLRVQPTQESIVMIQQYDKQYDKMVSDCIEAFKAMSKTSPMRMLGGRYFKGL